MEGLENILKSFKLKDHLNEKIWDGEKLNPEVRESILGISNEFINFLKIDIVVSDVVMTGSLANYNWSEYSDVDIHIITDFSQFSDETIEIYEDLFRLKKTIFNDKHNIKIFDYDVELYVQDEDELHFSSGVYSVLEDEWINKPKKESTEIDFESIKTKVKNWMSKIDDLIEDVKDEPIDVANKHIDKLKDKIKKYRTCGLEKTGELSDENMVFKALRRNGYIQKLFDFQSKQTDKKLSLN